MGRRPLTWDKLPKGPLWLEAPGLAAWQTRALARLREAAPGDPDLVWIMSSGTQSVNQVKCIALSRDAILASARGVNAFLKSTRRDTWLVAIPTYHVGGFAIAARAHLSGARITHLPKWSAEAFTASCAREHVTLSSLVPTQVHDLVATGLRAPPELRAIVVGGGALAPDLYLRARALGWPVLPSYGLTETASQVATAPLESSADAYPSLRPLPHAEIELRDGRVFLRAKSACRFVATANVEGVFTLEDPRRDGWLATEDLGAWDGEGGLRILGRRDDVVKVLGVLVAVPQVEGELQRFVSDPARVTVVAMPDARAGARLVAFTDTHGSLAALDDEVARYNAQAAGPSRIHGVCWVPEVPRTALGKVKKATLLKDVLG